MRTLFSVVILSCACLAVSAADKDDKPADSPKAKKTRELLKKKISLDIKDDSFRDVLDTLKEEIKGLRLKADTKAGVNLNKQFTYKCKDKTLAQVLEDLLKPNGWGYYILSNTKDVQWDGAIVIRPGKERGYPEKKK